MTRITVPHVLACIRYATGRVELRLQTTRILKENSTQSMRRNLADVAYILTTHMLIGHLPRACFRYIQRHGSRRVIDDEVNKSYQRMSVVSYVCLRSASGSSWDCVVSIVIRIVIKSNGKRYNNIKPFRLVQHMGGFNPKQRGKRHMLFAEDQGPRLLREHIPRGVPVARKKSPTRCAQGVLPMMQ